MTEDVPDLILHMGDYVYREWMCPWDQVCNDINLTAGWGDTALGW